LHTGVALLVQSLFTTHATHVPFAVSQWDVLPTHPVALVAVHWTQRWFVGSQIGAPVEQAPGPVVAPGTQPTQAPVVGSQTFAPRPPGQAPLSPLQEAWQVLVVGEHTGVPPVQPADWLGRHITQRFVAVLQIGAAALVQLVFVKQHAGPGLGQTAAVDVDDVTIVPVLPLPLGVVPVVAVPTPLPLVLLLPLPLLTLPAVVLLPPLPPSGVKDGAELPPQPV
jgi:hypothetical protein